MGETSISVTARTLERFNDAKADLNDAQTDVPDHNADSFLNALLDTWGTGRRHRNKPADRDTSGR
jgi:hypothetical protein